MTSTQPLRDVRSQRRSRSSQLHATPRGNCQQWPPSANPTTSTPTPTPRRTRSPPSPSSRTRTTCRRCFPMPTRAATQGALHCSLRRRVSRVGDVLYTASADGSSSSSTRRRAPARRRGARGAALHPRGLDRQEGRRDRGHDRGALGAARGRGGVGARRDDARAQLHARPRRRGRARAAHAAGVALARLARSPRAAAAVAAAAAASRCCRRAPPSAPHRRAAGVRARAAPPVFLPRAPHAFLHYFEMGGEVSLSSRRRRSTRCAPTRRGDDAALRRGAALRWRRRSARLARDLGGGGGAPRPSASAELRRASARRS